MQGPAPSVKGTCVVKDPISIVFTQDHDGDVPDPVSGPTVPPKPLSATFLIRITSQNHFHHKNHIYHPQNHLLDLNSFRPSQWSYCGLQGNEFKGMSLKKETDSRDKDRNTQRLGMNQPVVILQHFNCLLWLSLDNSQMTIPGILVRPGHTLEAKPLTNPIKTSIVH